MRLTSKSPEYWARESTLPELTSAVRELGAFDEESATILDFVYADRVVRLLSWAHETPTEVDAGTDLRHLADHLRRAAHDTARADLERAGDYSARWRLLSELLDRAVVSLEPTPESIVGRVGVAIVLRYLDQGERGQSRPLADVERHHRDLVRDDSDWLVSVGLLRVLHPDDDVAGSETRLQLTEPARRLGRKANAPLSLRHLASARPGGPPARAPDTFMDDLRALGAAGLARWHADRYAASLTDAGRQAARRPRALSLLEEIAREGHPRDITDVDAWARAVFRVDLHLLLAWELAHRHGDGDRAELTLSGIGRRALAALGPDVEPDS